jgi:hypothetical protein
VISFCPSLPGRVFFCSPVIGDTVIPILASFGNKKMSAFTYINVPGDSGSGPQHWQSLWEQKYENFYRVQQNDWEHPICSVWVEQLDKVIAQFVSPIILIGHSIGCITIIRWIEKKYRNSVKAAFLVAPSDPQNSNFPSPALGFDALPLKALPIASMLVTSSDDLYLSLDRASFLADCWGSKQKNTGKSGHLNSDSNLGMWTEGKKLLDELTNEVTQKLEL